MKETSTSNAYIAVIARIDSGVTTNPIPVEIRTRGANAANTLITA